MGRSTFVSTPGAALPQFPFPGALRGWDQLVIGLEHETLFKTETVLIDFHRVMFW
jgi:hypothetical protein